MAKPGILSMSSYPPGAVILPQEQAEAERILPSVYRADAKITELIRYTKADFEESEHEDHA